MSGDELGNGQGLRPRISGAQTPHPASGERGQRKGGINGTDRAALLGGGDQQAIGTEPLDGREKPVLGPSPISGLEKMTDRSMPLPSRRFAEVNHIGGIASAGVQTRPLDGTVGAGRLSGRERMTAGPHLAGGSQQTGVRLTTSGSRSVFVGADLIGGGRTVGAEVSVGPAGRSSCGRGNFKYRDLKHSVRNPGP